MIPGKYVYQINLWTLNDYNQREELLVDRDQKGKRFKINLDCPSM
jgi:hypothetical protein